MEGDTLDESWLEDDVLFDIESEGEVDEDDIEGDGEDEDEDEDDIQDKKKCDIIEPEHGMTFPSFDAVYEFWRAYGTAKGFPVRKRSSAQRPGGSHYFSLMCSLGGNPTSGRKGPSTSQPHTRLGCPVKLVGSSGTDGLWRITKCVLEHNHLLSPTKSRYFRCNRIIPLPIRRKLELNDRSGIRVSQNIRACIDEVGGYENATFLAKDAWNHVEKVRHLRLGEGDAMAIQDYFLNMQASNPGFRFSMDIDPKEGRLQNVFWADTRSIEAYKEFGRVVTFDTTYLVNRYDMPFAPFVGVNHHGHSVLLGCGLISSEDTETFCWLFRTWVKCMDGVAPEGIITDQDKAMQNAIRIVFPNTRHRWCLWHIMNKFPVKFAGYKKRYEIIRDLQSAIYDSQHPLDFEQSWCSVLEKYDLHENVWLGGLYDERQRWIPCFVKSSYWAGMSTTQRSESINAFFDGYVNAKTSLKQFVEQYGNALRSKVEKETEADYRSITQLIDPATHWAIEKQFQSVYTLSKFKEFQKEVQGKQYCGFVSTKTFDWGSEWVVAEDMIIGEGMPKRVNFTILNSESQDGCDLQCSCHLFEFRGILCRHAICGFITTFGNVKLPEKYIFKTWRKDVQRCHSRVRITYDGWVGTVEQERYDKLCTLFSTIAIKGSEDEDKTKELVECIDLLKDHLSNFQPSSSSDQPNELNDYSEVILDPNVTRGKGRPRENRLLSLREKLAKKIGKKTLKGSEATVLKDRAKEKLPTKRRKKKIVVEANQNSAPKTTPLGTQESSNSHMYTQESISSGGHPTMSYVPHVYTEEHEFVHGMNMNLLLGPSTYIRPDGYAPNVFGPSTYIRPGGGGYAPNVFGPSTYVQQQQVGQQRMQQHQMKHHSSSSATYGNKE